MIEKTIKLILRFNKVIIAGILLLTAILFFWFVRVELGASLAGLMPPPDDPESVFRTKTGEDFGSSYILLISLTHDHLFSLPTLKKIQKLTSIISAHPSVEQVTSLTNASIVKSKGDEIFMQDISDDIPTAEEEIEQFRRDIVQNPLYAGKLISDDEKTTVITVHFEETTTIQKIREKLLRKSVREVQALALAEAGPEEIRVSGFPATSAAIYRMLISDFSVFIPLSIFIIVVILCINFRSWWCVLLSLILISMAIVWTYASMAIFKVPIFVLTAFIPLIAAALGISYGIHLFTEYFRQRTLEGDPKKIVAGTFKNILLAIWLSAITTAIGFISLSVVGVVAVIEFSVFLTIVVLSLLFLVTLFIPSVLANIRPRSDIKTIMPKLPTTRASSGFMDLIVRYRYHILIFAGLVIIPCALGMKRLYVNTDLLELFRRSAPIKQATEFMAERFRGAHTIHIIIEGQKEGDMEDPSLLKSIEALQSFVDGQPVTGKTTSIIDHLKTINKALHNDNPNYYVLPESREEISQYLLAYSLADPQRTLDSYVDYDRRVAKIAVRTSITATAPALKNKKTIEDKCPELLPPNIRCKVTGDNVLVSIAAQKISYGIMYSFGFAVLAISAIMLLIFRSFKIAVVAMIPNLLPLLIILALMGWMRIPFNIGTSLTVCVAIGIAVDDTIHFMSRYFHDLRRTNHYLVRRYTRIRITADQIRALGTTFNRVRRPVILTSVAIFCGFISLAFSQFMVVIWFGTLTALTMVFCLLCDLILLPALLASIKI